MQEFVSRKNIERYQALLADGTLDEPTRKQVQSLLREELATLAKLAESKQPNPEEPKPPKQID